jgi:aspartate kinase
MVKVFKFGGASIKDVEAIKNIGEILKRYSADKLVIVFSAMGKVTNMLEKVVKSYVQNSDNETKYLGKVKDFHENIINALFAKNHDIFNEVNNLFIEIEWILEEDSNQDYAYDYDQIVSIGELLSTRIMSAYLSQIGFKNTWQDARDLIRTDNSYRNAKVDWDTTTTFIKNKIRNKHTITQGFIGCTSENFTTTLGREGSDFSAAILSYCLDAKEVVIWKDVPGMMNADPKYFSDAELLNIVSYDEAIELAFYGAKVIHPKTIQPLKKKNIPLQIKSFLTPDEQGSIITNNVEDNFEAPSFIIKEDQILISISDENLAFIVETHMSHIFSILAKHRVGVNLMQNSAVSFSICVDNDRYKIPLLIKDIKKSFKVLYNDKVNLFTVRHYTNKSVERFLQGKDVVLEQKSRNTMQFVAR